MNRTSTQSIALAEAKALIKGIADEQSLLLLSAPGEGKNATEAQAAASAGLPCGHTWEPGLRPRM
jgi:hypothetical protein